MCLSGVGVRVKGPCSPNDDMVLSQLVTKFRVRNQNLIVCQLWWCNYLNRCIMHKPFTSKIVVIHIELTCRQVQDNELELDHIRDSFNFGKSCLHQCHNKLNYCIKHKPFTGKTTIVLARIIMCLLGVGVRVKGPWSLDKDMVLSQLVTMFGVRN